ncbi:MAG: MotA/TolQ/ExbB proton channel family protein [Candidatus Eisenbacteria bacterium]
MPSHAGIDCGHLHSGLVKVDQGPAAVEKAIEASGGIEVAFLQRGLMIMATVANVAPLLGFLGTVSGMINAFEAIAAAEQVSAKLVASGISEALITTMAGLVVAIPVQIFHNYFLSRIDRFIIEMEESSIDLVNELEAGIRPKGETDPLSEVHDPRWRSKRRLDR